MPSNTIECLYGDIVKYDIRHLERMMNPMKQFDYVVKSPLGLDMRRTGLLSKLAKRYADTDITVSQGGRAAKAGQLSRLMGMCIRTGDRVTVTVDGPSETNAFFNARVFFENNL